MSRHPNDFFSTGGAPALGNGGGRQDLTISEQVSRDSSLGDKVADLLRRKIFNGELPHGTRLVEEVLAKQIGTSRGPLRYAFQLLAREGLVTITQGKGTYVEGLSAESIRQLYDVRLVLETRAVELATERVDEQSIKELQGLADRMAGAERSRSISDLVEADVAIHRRIWNLSGNYHLIRVLEYMMGPSITLMSLNYSDWDEWHRIVVGHTKVVAAVAAGDKQAAVRRLQETFDVLPPGPFPA